MIEIYENKTKLNGVSLGYAEKRTDKVTSTKSLNDIYEALTDRYYRSFWVETKEAIVSFRMREEQAAEKEKKAWKKSRTEKKNLLPSVNFNAYFPVNSYPNANNAEGLTGLIVLDFDKLTDAQVQETLLTAKDCPYTVLAFVSPSSNGVKIIVRYEGCDDANVWQHLYKYVEAEILTFLPDYLVPDEQATDVNRKCDLAYTEQAHLNTGASAIQVPQVLVSEWKAQVQAEVKKTSQRQDIALIEGESIPELDGVISWLQDTGDSLTFIHLDWVNLGLSLVNSIAEKEVALKYFHLFSQCDESYNEKAVNHKFKGLWARRQKTGQNGKKRTIASILYSAREKGYIFPTNFDCEAFARLEFDAPVSKEEAVSIITRLIKFLDEKGLSIMNIYTHLEKCAYSIYTSMQDEGLPYFIKLVEASDIDNSSIERLTDLTSAYKKAATKWNETREVGYLEYILFKARKLGFSRYEASSRFVDVVDYSNPWIFSVPEEKYTLKKQFLGQDDVLCDKVMKHIEDNTKSLIKAPTGSGKTHLIFNKIRKYATAKGLKIIFCVPTQAIAQQQIVGKTDYAFAVYGTQSVTSKTNTFRVVGREEREVIELVEDEKDLLLFQDSKAKKTKKVKKKIQVEKIEEIDINNVECVITTYHSFGRVIAAWGRDLSDTIVIIDECQHLITDSFRMDGSNFVLDNCHNANRILLLSAFPTNYFSLMNYKYLSIEQETPKHTSIYDIRVGSKKIESAEAAISLIEPKKQGIDVVFWDNRDGLKSIMDYFISTNIYKREEIAIINSDEKQSLDYYNIVNNDEIREGIKLLLTTQLIADGVNIKNTNIKKIIHIACWNIELWVQFYARFRNLEKFEVYNIREDDNCTRTALAENSKLALHTLKHVSTRKKIASLSCDLANESDYRGFKRLSFAGDIIQKYTKYVAHKDAYEPDMLRIFNDEIQRRDTTITNDEFFSQLKDAIHCTVEPLVVNLDKVHGIELAEIGMGIKAKNKAAKQILKEALINDCERTITAMFQYFNDDVGIRNLISNTMPQCAVQDKSPENLETLSELGEFLETRKYQDIVFYMNCIKKHIPHASAIKLISEYTTAQRKTLVDALLYNCIKYARLARPNSLRGMESVCFDSYSDFEQPFLECKSLQDFRLLRAKNEPDFDEDAVTEKNKHKLASLSVDEFCDMVNTRLSIQEARKVVMSRVKQMYEVREFRKGTEFRIWIGKALTLGDVCSKMDISPLPYIDNIIPNIEKVVKAAEYEGKKYDAVPF